MLRCGMRSVVERWVAVLDGPAVSTTMRFLYRLFWPPKSRVARSAMHLELFFT